MADFDKEIASGVVSKELVEYLRKKRPGLLHEGSRKFPKDTKVLRIYGGNCTGHIGRLEEDMDVIPMVEMQIPNELGETRKCWSSTSFLTLEEVRAIIGDQSNLPIVLKEKRSLLSRLKRVL